MNPLSFEGVWTALVTPFHHDGSIDFSSYLKLLERQNEAGVSGVVVCGTTGESPTLSDSEKIELVDFARKNLPKSLRVMGGSGSNSTQASLTLSKKMRDVGADSFLVVTPPYNKPSLAGLIAHYSAISNACPEIPICAYHVPGRTGQRLNAEQINQILAIPGVSAVKEATGDLVLASQILNIRPDACLLSGDDLTFLPGLAVGMRGCVSVFSNIFPKTLVKLAKAFQENDLALALDIHKKCFTLFELLFCEPNPGPVKLALSELILSKPTLRLPLVELESKNAEKLLEETRKFVRLTGEI